MKRASSTHETRRAPFASPLPRPVRRRAGRTVASRTPATMRTIGIERSRALRDHARKTLGFALGKFAPSIGRVSVRLFDTSKRDRENTKACSIRVVLPGRPSVVVETAERTYRAAVDVSIHRAERAVRRALERRTGARKVRRVAGVPALRRRPARRG